jgi:hypothetical protein
MQQSRKNLGLTSRNQRNGTPARLKRTDNPIRSSIRYRSCRSGGVDLICCEQASDRGADRRMYSNQSKRVNQKKKNRRNERMHILHACVQRIPQSHEITLRHAVYKIVW